MGRSTSTSYRTTADCEREGFKLLAEIDESALYEVDETVIFAKPGGGYLMRQASGCSCWDGEWDEQEFDSLDAIEAHLMSTDTGRYSPSLKGTEQLMAEARKHDAKSCVELQCN